MPVKLSNFKNIGDSHSLYPSVAISGTGTTATVLVAWTGVPGDVQGELLINIMVRRSTDGGATFGPVTNLSNRTTGNPPDRPSVAISGTTALVAWQDGSLGEFEIFRSRSTNGGASFGLPVNLSNSSGFSGLPSVAISGSGATATIIIAWEDDRVSARENIFLSRSTDGGLAFGVPFNLSSNATGYAHDPSVAISGTGATSTVLVAYEAGSDIYLKRSIDGGATFGTSSRLTNNSGFTLTPSVAMSGTGTTETSVVAWSDNVSAGDDIFLTRSQ